MHARLRPTVKRTLVFLVLGAAFAAGFAPRALAAWGSAPVTVASSAGAQTGPILVNAPNGVYVAWTDRRDTSGVWANRVDSSGVAESAIGFPVGPPDSAVAGLVATADGVGGMVLAWSDLRSAPRAIFANRIVASGSHQWTKNGVRVGTGTGTQYSPSIAPDGTGGVFVAWQRVTVDSTGIYAQHLGPDGSPLWGGGGVMVCDSAGLRETPQIVADRLGGAVLCWNDYRSSNVQVFVQRLSSAGAPLWGRGGISIDGTRSTARGRLACQSDGTTVIMFQDPIDTSPSPSGVYAQRLDVNGVSTYSGGNRVAISPVDPPMQPVAVFTRASGAALFVYASATDIRARVLASSGADVWGGTNGLALASPAPAAASGVSAVSDGADGAWVTWTDGGAVRTQHVVAAGTLPMGSTPVTLSPATVRARGAAAGALLPTGDFVTVWEDADTGGAPDTNLVAQRLGPNRVVGAYWRVVATAGANGTLTPGPGTHIVAEHDSLRFRAVGNGSYHVTTMIADGVGYAAVPNLTFHDVTANHTLVVSFDNQPITSEIVTTPDAFQGISFPFTFANDSVSVVFDDVWPPDATRWRLGRWDPVAKLYDVPPADLVHLQPGESWWFATKVADTLGFSGTAVSESDFTMSLAPATAESTGWNQIASPFRFPVAVSALQVRSGTGSWDALVSPSQPNTDPVVMGWSAAGGYQPANTMLSGRTYWVFKRTPANVSLRVPFEYSQGAFATGLEPGFAAGDWTVSLELTQDGAPAAHLSIGAGARALTYARVPVSPGRDLSLWTAVDGAEYSAVAAPDEGALAYDVFASSSTALAPASLRVSLEGVSSDREVTLSDPAAGWSRAVRDGDVVTLALGSDARRLRLAIAGTGALAPSGVTTLRAAAPNPFSDRTALSFVLGAAGDLRAQVYDVTGRRVADLSRRGLSAGEHVIPWNGHDASGVRVKPGVYLLRWSAGGRSGTARIVSLQ